MADGRRQIASAITMIIFNKVSKRFKDGTVVLDEVSFSVDKGEFIFLVGPSGAGKTTISRLLLGQSRPSRGKIFIDNQDLSQLKKKDIPKLRRKIGTAFQDFKILTDRTVKENIALALEIIHRKKSEIDQRVQQLLDLVGLAGKHDFFPGQLSGGELQRVVIARALAHQPLVLFADEPTGNLDLDTSWQIIEVLKRINDAGTTVIIATHNNNIVETLNQRVLEIKEGKVTELKKATAEKKKISSKEDEKKKESTKKTSKKKKEKKTVKKENKKAVKEAVKEETVDKKEEKGGTNEQS